MVKYRKKPVEVEAVQLCLKNWGAVCEFLGDIISASNPGILVNEPSDTCYEFGPWIGVYIPTLEGRMLARHGDWIIKGVKGEFYPCKPDIFAATYERVS